MISSKFMKIILFSLTVSLVILTFFSEARDYLTLTSLQEKLVLIQNFNSLGPIKAGAIFFSVYVLATAISLPGATVLTLLGGAIFGPWIGLLLVSFASTIGSTLSFLVSRFLLRDFFMHRFEKQFKTIDENVNKDGAVYLATVRLIPVFPFFVVNIMMGLTSISAATFYWVSQLGMLPGTAVYVYAGRNFSELRSLRGILSPEMILTFVLLGLLPFLGKILIAGFRRRKAYKGFKKPSVFEYNLIAVGAGSAGLVTAYIAATVKSKVALVERDKMGGDCLNTGCVPSKALIKSAKIVHLGKRAREFGLSRVDVEFKFSEVMDRVHKVVREIEPHDSPERYGALGVDCITGEAKLIDPWTVQVGSRVYTSKNIVIATGAGPSIPEIPGLKSGHFVTSDTIWQIKELPKRFVVMGGGAIGAEMAQAFARFGSEVTIIEGSDRILSKEDPEVSKLISTVFIDEGIRVLTSHKVTAFKNEVGKKIIICEKDGTLLELEYDLVLVAVGRRPNTKGLGLEELGVKLRPDGTIDVNGHLETNYPNIYACGDVTGPYQLTHMASHQAWYCAVNSLFPVNFKVDYSIVPWCTYTDPEVATVGETETSAKAKQLDYEVTQYDLAELDRAITEGDKKGMVRVITQKGSDKILGATIAGAQASSMIVEYVAAMKNKKGLNSILGTIHVYPSYGEANKYAAGQWKKDHVNPKIMRLLEKYFTWTRS